MVERKGWWKGICILGVALAFTLLLTTPTLAWWNSDWKYRRPITIQSENALTDYQVLIELNSTNFDFSKANPDGSDIRFVDEDDVTKLSYWIEEWNTSSQTTKIWVKVPSIPTGEKTIYLYYNNSDAVSESNLSQVCPGGIHDGYCCEFFDDFSDNDVSDWSTNMWGSNSGDVIADNYQMRLRVYKCYNVEAYHDIGVYTSTTLAFRYDWETYADDWMESVGWKVLEDGEEVDKTVISGSNPSVGRGETRTGSVEAIANITNGNVTLLFCIYQSGSCANSDHKNTYLWVDNVRVRKYVSPEPITLVGGEEMPPPPPPIEVTYIPPSTLRVKLNLIEKRGYILIGTSPNKFCYAYPHHGNDIYTLTTTFLQPNKTYYIKACDADGNCTGVVEFVCSKETELEKKNFTAPFNNLMQGGNLLNISKLGETIPSVYTSLLTDMFWAMFFGGIFLAYWIRQEDVMLPSIVGLITGGVLIVMLPPSAQHIAYILLVISIAGTLYTIIKARR
ncbi:MAG: DUF2341 domain-containing protein [Candidatus Thorarchaeota archaeon]